MLDTSQMFRAAISPAKDFVSSLFASPDIDPNNVLGRHGAAELESLLPYRFYDEDEELYIMDDGYGFVINVMPMIGVSPQRYDMLTSVLARSVPDDCTIQILHHSSPKIGYRLQRWYDARSQKDELFEELASRRLNFLANHVFQPIGSSRNFMLRDHNVYFSVSKEGIGDDEVVKELSEFKINLLATLKNVFGSAHLLKPAEFISMTGDILNPNQAVNHNVRTYSNDIEVKHQIINPDTIFDVNRKSMSTSSVRNYDWFQGENRQDNNGIEDDVEIRCFEVSRIPKHIDFGVMSNSFGRFFMSDVGHSAPVIQCLNIYYPPHEKTKEALEAQSIRSRQVAEGLTGKFNAETRDRAADFQEAQKQVNDNGRICYICYHGAVMGSPEDCSSALRSARTLFQSLQFEVSFSHKFHLPTFFGLLPMMGAFGVSKDFIKFKRRKKVISNVIAALAPIFGEHIGTPNSCMLFVGRRGQITSWSPFVEGGEGNHNAIVSGAPGAGKSVLLSDCMMCHVANGGHVCVIDNGFSFKSLALVSKGSHYTFRADGKFCLNPFDMIDEDRAKVDKEYLANRLELCVQLFGQMINGSNVLTQEESGIIRAVIDKVWASHKTLGGANEVAFELSKFTSDSDTANTGKMVNAMRPYFGDGQYANMFNGRNTLDMSNKITVFETKPLENKPGLRDVVVTALFGLIDMKVTSDRSRKDLVVLDECWVHFKSLALSKVIEGWGRRLRKENGGLLIGTQTMEELNANESTRAILATSQWKVAMRTSRSSVETMDKLQIVPDGFAKKCLNDLTTVPGQYAEAMIMCNAWYALVRLPLDPFSASMYTTTADRVVAINELEASGMSLRDALISVSSTQIQKQKAKDRIHGILDEVQNDELLTQEFRHLFSSSEEVRALSSHNEILKTNNDLLSEQCRVLENRLRVHEQTEAAE